MRWFLFGLWGWLSVPAMAAGDSMDEGGTTTGTWEAEQRMEQLPRAAAAPGIPASHGTCVSCASSGTAAEELPSAHDFAADASVRAPILVFFTSASCPYCREVENLYLRPMHARGAYRGQLLIRTIEVGSDAALTDFTGQRTSHAGFARRERATFTPTIRIYDGAGNALAPSLRGYTTPELYLGTLEHMIAQAIRAERRRRTASCGPVNATDDCAPSVAPRPRAGG